MSLARCERGAAMVIGLCFAILLLSTLFYVLGVAEAVLFRERVLDAADAAAFSAAVVNARGMNLIALVNMTMAAVLAILVGLRLAVTIGMAGTIVCGLLAWPTSGASLAGVAPLTQVTKQINQVAEKAKKPVRQALNVLHSAGKAVSYVVPIGSNLGVIDQTVAHYGVIGVAIPSRLTLPVEDGEFSVLCQHAGRYAGDVAMFPLSPILPSSVRDRMGDVAGRVVAAGSSWFCDGKGEPPSFQDSADEQLEELPRFASQAECERLSTDDHTEPGELERVCHLAARERLASAPNRSGLAREGEPLCPSDCQRSTHPGCPPKSIADCEPDESRRLEALRGDESNRAAYERRKQLARSQCRPESEGGRDDLQGFWWLEETRTRSYVWNPVTRLWSEDADAIEVGEPRFVQRAADDRTFPCGEGGAVGEGYELTSGPVCRDRGACLEGGSGPCARAAPAHGRATRFRERTVEVTAILRCAYPRQVDDVATPPMNVAKDMSDGDAQGGNAPPRPFGLERDVYLGGSDFQLRTLVLASVPNRMEGVVQLASNEREKGWIDTLLRIVTKLGGVGLSQGEYYFDFAKVDESLDDETDQGDRSEWMWHMGWRARLRPFRFRHGVADAERSDDRGSTRQPDLAIPGADRLKVDELDCARLGDHCDAAREVMDGQEPESGAP